MGFSGSYKLKRYNVFPPTIRLTVFSLPEDPAIAEVPVAEFDDEITAAERRSSCFISENCTFDGSARSVATL